MKSVADGNDWLAESAVFPNSEEDSYTVSKFLPPTVFACCLRQTFQGRALASRASGKKKKAVGSTLSAPGVLHADSRTCLLRLDSSSLPL